MMKYERPKEKKQPSFIQIKEEARKPFKNYNKPMKFYRMKIKERYMINTERMG